MLRKLLVLVLGAVPLLQAREAFSANLMIAGSECRLSFNTAGSVNYLDGEIISSGNTMAFVDCPVLNGLNGIRVHYVDNSSAGNLRCYGHRRHLNGAPEVSSSKFSCAVVGGCPTNVDPLFADTLQRRIEFGSPRGFTGVTCELPRGASIRFIELFP